MSCAYFFDYNVYICFHIENHLLSNMNTFLPRFFTFLFFLSFIMQSCHNKEAILNNISHKWLLDKGFRNEKETDSLTGLYFEFKQSGEVVTNLNGQDERLSFTLKGEDIIELNGTTEGIFLNIKELSESKLVLQTDLQGFNFKFELLKVK